MRFPSACIALCLLTGCTLFPREASPPQTIRQVSESELRSLVPDRWCRVQLRAVRQNGSESRKEHIGLVQSADADSVTLTDVTTRGRYTSTSPFRNVPYLSRLYKNTGVGAEDNPNLVTVPRDQMESVELISPEEAAELKRPFERIGIDFDFNLNVATESRDDNVATNIELPEATDPEATEVDPTSLPPGQWCQVKLHDEQRGSFKTHTTYIGRLQRADDESVTLTEVTTWEVQNSTSPLRKVPQLSHLYEDPVTVPKDEPAPVTVRLDRIQCLNPITAERAAKVKQPRERVGMDFYTDVAFDSGGKNVDPTSLPPGQWCQVRLHDKKRGSTQIHTTYIGQLQRADDESIALTEVTTWGYYSSTSPLRRFPWLEDIFTDGAPEPRNEPGPITVRRDRITRVMPITAERATKLKEPLKPFGDFDSDIFELTTDSRGRIGLTTRATD